MTTNAKVAISHLEAHRIALDDLLFNYRNQSAFLEARWTAFTKDIDRLKNDLKTAREGVEYLSKLELALPFYETRKDIVINLDRNLKELMKAFVELRNAEVSFTRGRTDQMQKSWIKSEQISGALLSRVSDEQFLQHPEVVEYSQRHTLFKEIVSGKGGTLPEVSDSILEGHLDQEAIAKTGSPLRTLRMISQSRGSPLGGTGPSRAQTSGANKTKQPAEISVHMRAELKPKSFAGAALPDCLAVIKRYGDTTAEAIATTETVIKNNNPEWQMITIPLAHLMGSQEAAMDLDRYTNTSIFVEVVDKNNPRGEPFISGIIPLPSLKTNMSVELFNKQKVVAGNIHFIFVGRTGGYPRPNTTVPRRSKLSIDGDSTFSDDAAASKISLKDSVSIVVNASIGKERATYLAIKKIKPSGKPESKPSVATDPTRYSTMPEYPNINIAVRDIADPMSSDAVGNSEILIEIIDHENEESIGSAQIALKTLKTGAVLNMLDKKGKEKGTITLKKIKWYKADGSDGADAGGKSNIGTAGKLSLQVKAEVNTRKDLYLAVKMVNSDGSLSSSFHETESIESAAPVWRKFDLQLESLLKKISRPDSAEIAFQIYEKQFGIDDMICSTKSKLKALNSGLVLKLIDENSESIGSLTFLAVESEGGAGGGSSSGAKAASSPLAFKCQATLLKKKDAYLVVKLVKQNGSLGKKLIETEAVEALNPEWPVLEFAAEEILKENADPTSAEISLEVYEKEFGSDDLIGRTRVTAAMIRQGLTVELHDDKGKDAGTLAFKTVQSPWANLKGAKAPASNNVTLHLRATLPKKKDSYVVVKNVKIDGSLSKPLLESAVVDNSQNPEWSGLDLLVSDLLRENADPAAAEVALEIYEQEFGSDDLIGSVRLALPLLKSGTTHSLNDKKGRQIGSLEIAKAQTPWANLAPKSATAAAPLTGNLTLHISGTLLKKKDAYITVRNIKSDGSLSSKTLVETEAIESLSPEWQPFDIPVTKLLKEIKDPELAEICLQVYEKEFGNDDLIGFVRIGLSKLRNNLTLELVDENEKTAGSLLLKNVQAPWPTAGKSGKNSGGDALARKASPRTAGPVSLLLSATLLKKKDAYVSVKTVKSNGSLSKPLIETEAVKSLTPDWPVFELQSTDLLKDNSDPNTAEMCLQIYEKEIGIDDLIGQVRVVMGKLKSGMTLDLVNEDGKPAGQLFVKDAKTPWNAKPPKASDGGRGSLASPLPSLGRESVGGGSSSNVNNTSGELVMNVSCKLNKKKEAYLVVSSTNGEGEIHKKLFESSRIEGDSPSWACEVAAADVLRSVADPGQAEIVFEVYEDEFGRDGVIGSFRAVASKVKSNLSGDLVDGKGREVGSITFTSVQSPWSKSSKSKSSLADEALPAMGKKGSLKAVKPRDDDDDNNDDDDGRYDSIEVRINGSIEKLKKNLEALPVDSYITVKVSPNAAKEKKSSSKSKKPVDDGGGSEGDEEDFIVLFQSEVNYNNRNPEYEPFKITADQLAELFGLSSKARATAVRDLLTDVSIHVYMDGFEAPEWLGAAKHINLCSKNLEGSTVEFVNKKGKRMGELSVADIKLK